MCFLRPRSHSAGENAEVGNLAFTSIGDRSEPIVFRLETGEKLLT